MAYFNFKSKYFDVDVEDYKISEGDEAVKRVEKTLALADKRIEGMFEKVRCIQDFNLIYESVHLYDLIRNINHREVSITPSLAIHVSIFDKKDGRTTITFFLKGGTSINTKSAILIETNPEVDSGFSVTCWHNSDSVYAIIKSFILEYDGVEKFFLSVIQDYIDAVKKEKKLMSEVTPDKEDASSRFKKLFYNTGRTLNDVVQLMLKDGYSKSEVVNSAFKVLGSVKWDE